MPEKRVPQRTNTGNRSARRYTGGPPRRWRPVRLAEPDAQSLDGVLGGVAIDEALRRVAAAAAADPDATRAALAPLLAIEAWDEEIL